MYRIHIQKLFETHSITIVIQPLSDLTLAMFSRSQLELLTKDQLIDVVLQLGQLSVHVSEMVNHSPSYVPPVVSLPSAQHSIPSSIVPPTVIPQIVPIYAPSTPIPTKFVDSPISKGVSGWNSMCKLLIEIVKEGSVFFKKTKKVITITDARTALSKIGEQLYEQLPQDTHSPTTTASHKKPDWNKIWSSYCTYDEQKIWNIFLYTLYDVKTKR